MDVALANKIKQQLQRELMRRQLIEYFTGKGYENSFDRPLYPPTCWDLPVKIKNLFNKVEVIPFVDETNLSTGTVRLGWNLYAMGTNRLALGQTSHSNVADIQRSVLGEHRSDMPVEFATTPHEVIDFVLKVLDQNKTGYIELPSDFRIPPGAFMLPLGGARGPRTGSPMMGGGAMYSHSGTPLAR